MKEEEIKLLIYIFSDTKNSKGQTIDERGMQLYNTSDLTFEYFLRNVSQNVMTKDDWVQKEFFLDEAFVNEIKLKASKVKDKAFRDQLMKENNSIENVEELVATHPFCSQIFPLIGSIFI